jgi:hypothetical protein
MKWREMIARALGFEMQLLDSSRLVPNGTSGQPVLSSAAARFGVASLSATVNGICDLIGRIVDSCAPNECANAFTSCGYDPE